MQKIVTFKTYESLHEKVEKLFELEKARILTFFSETSMQEMFNVEHIGGTSIPFLYSKGDLDLNIRAKDKADFETIINCLKENYEINQPENWNMHYASFKDNARDIGIQVTILKTPEDYFVPQRDFLRRHFEKVDALNKLKLRFEGKLMDDYRIEKAKFFKTLLI
jgi:GrpB-like predicted nucleotidyltransferase (UPF0157 family)